ncbi:hypothetical protein [Pseudomonas sp. RIT-PI-S]|uniref:glycosyltransferase n=1 Tax=Pseudomonas sp. RIT-PI-S TaxID=3035295 RepID=UPI0021D99BD5|nr:hypothetical protein [Pseudomonas sp. RIT-PI-S]
MTEGVLRRVCKRVARLLGKGKKRLAPRGPVYMFLPINGAGLGHLTRCLAIARQLRQRQPEAQVIFVTTSIAVPIVQRFGFICHHISPFSLCGLDSREWNRLLGDTIEVLMRLYRPSVFVFDGSAPYAGLRRLIRRHRAVRFAWVRRQGYKPCVDPTQLARQEVLFERVLLPSEPFEEQRRQPDARVCTLAPVLLLERGECLNREEAALRLGVGAALRAGKRFVYVQLGAGNINETGELLEHVVAVLEQRGYAVVIGASPIALAVQAPVGAALCISDYPNSRYFPLFDFAVLAAGYNSVCEAVGMGLPAIFVPNPATLADDQLARARATLPLGPYVVMEAAGSFEASLHRLLSRIAQPLPPAEKFDGAAQAAECLAAMAVPGEGKR